MTNSYNAMTVKSNIIGFKETIVNSFFKEAGQNIILS